MGGGTTFSKINTDTSVVSSSKEVILENSARAISKIDSSSQTEIKEINIQNTYLQRIKPNKIPQTNKIQKPFKSIVYTALVEDTKRETLMHKQIDEDIKMDKENRLDKLHMSCKCQGGFRKWFKQGFSGEAYSLDHWLNHVSFTPLHPIREEKEEDWHTHARLTIVVRESGNGNDQEQKVLQVSEKKEEIKTYLDSGATSHLFNRRDIFNTFTDQQTKLVTACDNKKQNIAHVGEIKQLTHIDGKSMVCEGKEGIFSDILVENLISVGKLCEDDHTVVFDKYGCVVFKGEVKASGSMVCAQNRDLLSGLYPLTLTTRATSKDCRTQSDSVKST
jgi:hypothetical protein